MSSQVPSNAVYAVATGTAAQIAPIVSPNAPASNNTTGPNGPLHLGQLWVDTGSDTIWGLAGISTFNGVTSASWINLGGGASALNFQTDAGIAVPFLNNIQIVGGPGITTTGVGNVVTINAAGVLTVDITPNTGVNVTNNTFSLLGTAVAASGFPIRSNGTAANSIQIEAQRASQQAASSAANAGLASFDNTSFTVDANGWVQILGGSVAETFQVNAFTAPGTNPVVPTGAGLVTVSGTAVAASGIPVRTDSIAANSYQIEVQRSSQQVASAAANAGLASFNANEFVVDANGWVSGLNGLPASKFTVQAFTAPGTNPVVPSAGGFITISGTVVAAHAIPIQTDSLAANALNVELQISSAQAVSTATANGLCHFNSADFTVDAAGFVSSISGTAPWLDSAGGALVNHTGYFATAAAVYTLPAGAVNGDSVEIADFAGGGVVVTAQGGDLIRISNTDSSVNGTATSTQIGDALRLIFRAAGQVWVCVPGAAGNWILA